MGRVIGQGGRKRLSRGVRFQVVIGIGSEIAAANQFQDLGIRYRLAHLQLLEKSHDKRRVQTVLRKDPLDGGERQNSGARRSKDVLFETLRGKNATVDFLEEGLDVQDDPALFNVVFVLEEQDAHPVAQSLA